MNRLRIESLVAAVISGAALILLACGEQTPVAPPPPPPPVPVGTHGLNVQLRSPNVSDGAVFLEIRGPGLKPEVTGPQGSQVYAELVGDTVLRAVVVGSLEGGVLMFVPLRDRQPASSYRAVVLEVAERNGALRSDISGYSVGFEVQ